MEDFIFIPAENLMMSAFDIKPLKGFELKPNYPNCCEFHKRIEQDLLSWFDKFPDCCKEHKELRNSQFGFKKELYLYCIPKVLNQLGYTEHLIKEKIETDDWLSDIADYIEYNIMSFGKPNVGLHIYEKAVIDYVKSAEFIPKPKKNILLNLLTAEPTKTTQKPEKKIDIRILINTYQKWLSIFPFNLPFFQELKPKFEKSYPILDGTTRVNRYSGMAATSLITEERLLIQLIDTTRELLKSIDTKAFYESLKLDDSQQLKIALINETHRVRQEAILTNFSNGESRYVTIIKSWLNNEKIFFKELSGLLNESKQPNEQTKYEKLMADLGKYQFEKLKHISNLNQGQRNSLLLKISESSIAYQIAMLDYLGFFEHLQKQYFTTKYKMYRILAQILNSKERTVKGNISVLNPHSKEDRIKYTSYKHKEVVINDYQNIK